MNENELFKEIDLIQDCINRMAKNSFMLKGWALTLFAGVTAVTKGSNFSDLATLVCATIVPYVCFWILDAYFLHTEQKYRKLYDIVLKKRKNNDDEGQFELDPKVINNGCFIKTMFSSTLLFFYGIPLLSCIILLLVRYFA